MGDRYAWHWTLIQRDTDTAEGYRYSRSGDTAEWDTDTAAQRGMLDHSIILNALYIYKHYILPHKPQSTGSSIIRSSRVSRDSGKAYGYMRAYITYYDMHAL